jgi:c-di-GMP-binding flagellar brake protein YcgR
MEKKKSSWDDIPPLDGLEVDWEYKPENPLGKRAWARIANRELFFLFAVKSIPVKVVAKNYDKSGYLLDISKKGLAVLLPARLQKEQPVKIGLFLGGKKVTSRAMVRNTSEVEGKYRTGLEFVELDKELENYLVGLGATKGFQK